MKTLRFRPSTVVSLGLELEFQIIDPHTYDLSARAKDLIRSVVASAYQKKMKIKPEITQGMIEINSSIHHSLQEMYEECLVLHAFLLDQAKDLGISFAGGGTHPFQQWFFSKIFPSKRFKNLSRQYRYLSKRSTVFGQHIHVGCNSGDDAIYLTHALARFVPQFIALSASSPFYQGVDTGYHSSRSNVFNAFPLSGVIPYVANWKEFSAYYYKMRNLGIIESMKDFYWDIRPKPEFGTVELRVCDTPLTIKKAIMITAYVQAVSYYLLQERPVLMSPDLYYLYGYNRFQASRYGYQGDFINPITLKHDSIAADILETHKRIEQYADFLNNKNFITPLIENVEHDRNDAIVLREILKKVKSLPEVVQEQCAIWARDFI